jgi:hypothetical protein
MLVQLLIHQNFLSGFVPERRNIVIKVEAKEKMSSSMSHFWRKLEEKWTCNTRCFLTIINSGGYPWGHCEWRILYQLGYDSTHVTELWVGKADTTRIQQTCLLWHEMAMNGCAWCYISWAFTIVRIFKMSSFLGMLSRSSHYKTCNATKSV